MAAVEYNVYNEKTMSIVVNGEPETDQAEQFLKDKLCEQGLKGASVPTSSIARTDATPSNFPRVSFSDAPSFPRPSAVVEVYAEWAGRCNSCPPRALKRLKLEKDYDPAVFVMLHCKAEEHEMLEEYRGKSMPHASRLSQRREEGDRERRQHAPHRKIHRGLHPKRPGGGRPGGEPPVPSPEGRTGGGGGARAQEELLAAAA